MLAQQERTAAQGIRRPVGDSRSAERDSPVYREALNHGSRRERHGFNDHECPLETVLPGGLVLTDTWKLTSPRKIVSSLPMNMISPCRQGTRLIQVPREEPRSLMVSISALPLSLACSR